MLPTAVWVQSCKWKFCIRLLKCTHPLRRSNAFNNFNFTLEDGNDVAGDEKIYLKGTEGSIGIIDLFNSEDLDGNNISDELDAFKSQRDNWLINEANLHLINFQYEYILHVVKLKKNYACRI